MNIRNTGRCRFCRRATVDRRHDCPPNAVRYGGRGYCQACLKQIQRKGTPERTRMGWSA